MTLKLVCFIPIFYIAISEANEPIASIESGSLRGTIDLDANGNKFYSFLAIPYVQPPVGSKRFQNPEPVSFWSGVKDATKESPVCPQSSAKFSVVGQEDCLYLNVYTRNLPNEQTKLKPVMVWIHGGAFRSGTGRTTEFGPEFLLTEDIVLVSINYRLGFLGFLKTSKIPGNMGFRDQIEALKWVQRNIRNFNGNPNSVTIFGESAGGASVHYLVLSPLSRGLFHKAIMQSGAALNIWAENTSQDVVKVAQLYNSSIDNEDDAVNILGTLPVKNLIKLQAIALKHRDPNGLFLVGLSIEKPSNDSFISRQIIDIIRSGEYNKVPMIFGYNNKEGIHYAIRHKTKVNSTEIIMRNIPGVVYFGGNTSLRNEFIHKIENFYFRQDQLSALTGFYSDSLLIAGIYASIKNHAFRSTSPIFVYKLSQDTKLNYMKAYYNVSNIPGTSHADDLGYLFRTPLTPNIEPGSLEDLSWKRLVKLWTNFAKYSNPTPDENDLGIIWKPTGSEEVDVLHIKNDGVRMEVDPEKKLLDFWRNLYQQSNHTYDYL